jgi:hypothetical protein
MAMAKVVGKFCHLLTRELLILFTGEIICKWVTLKLKVIG